MSKKEEILNILIENRGVIVSGEQIAATTGVTRAYVSKAVRELNVAGYNIESCAAKGYKMCDSTKLSKQEIQYFLQDDSWNIITKDIAASTNDDAKAMALAGAPEKTLVAADEQTKGKGRKGKSFYSPKDTGIYFSFILRPKMKIDQCVKMTCVAAVAVARAIEEAVNAEAKIKWVNDVIVNGKKVCGILTEATTDLESGNLEYLVVGIGINLSTDDFPEEIKGVAGSIESNINRNEMIAKVLKNMEFSPTPEIMNEYRRRSYVIGKRVKVLDGKSEKMAMAVDIDSDGRLIVKDEYGVMHALSSGEISVKI